eukprot:30896-Pyramimonas_sp.AAC.1
MTHASLGMLGAFSATTSRLELGCEGRSTSCAASAISSSKWSRRGTSTTCAFDRQKGGRRKNLCPNGAEGGAPRFRRQGRRP